MKIAAHIALYYMPSLEYTMYLNMFKESWQRGTVWLEMVYGLVVKISDFGLSRENVVHTMSDGDKHITWKWLAPEVLLQGTEKKY